MNRILKVIGVLFFGAIYFILGVILLAAVVGAIVSIILQSQIGLAVFALACVLLVASTASIIHKPTRARIENSKNGELPMLLMGVVSGTAVGMLLSTVALIVGAPGFAFSGFLLFSVLIPVSSMLLERIGWLDAFDCFNLSDIFDD